MRYLILIACCIASSICIGAERAIEILANDIQKKAPHEVREVIVEKYGQANRDIGSGFRIEQWDIHAGILTFHPATGVYFQKDGVIHSLIETTNYVKEALFGSYEMSSLPDHNNHGSSYWLGNLELSDRSYLFKRSRLSYDKELPIRENYFFLHPEGMVKIDFASESITRGKLESIKDGATIATITFSTKDSVAKVKYSMVTRKSPKMLFFASEKGVPFKMDKAWGSYW